MAEQEVKPQETEQTKTKPKRSWKRILLRTITITLIVLAVVLVLAIWQIDRVAAIRRIVERYHAVVVLKGPRTLVAAPGRDEVFACEAGNPFMALGGMGDLLAGVLAARWAYLAKQGGLADEPSRAFTAACAAVWLHATASDSIVRADPPGDPSIAATAQAIASIRVMMER